MCAAIGSGEWYGAPGDAHDRAGPHRNRAANPEDPMNIHDTSLREALARGRTLPAEWYTDPKRFELEQGRIFAASWNYVGRVEQVVHRGERVAHRLQVNVGVRAHRLVLDHAIARAERIVGKRDGNGLGAALQI